LLLVGFGGPAGFEGATGAGLVGFGANSISLSEESESHPSFPCFGFGRSLDEDAFGTGSLGTAEAFGLALGLLVGITGGSGLERRSMTSTGIMHRGHSIKA
jgi:hypothetical protein